MWRRPIGARVDWAGHRREAFVSTVGQAADGHASLRSCRVSFLPFCVSTAFRYFALMRLCLAARRWVRTPSRPGDRELSAGVCTNNDTMPRQRHSVPWRSRPATADQRVAAARDGLSWGANAAPLLCTTPHGGAEGLAPPQHAPFRLITASVYAAQCIS
jgi:hypothetical protein